MLSSALLVLTVFFLAACNKKEDSSQPPAQMPALPVSFITMAATSVPISTEAVAQTEGAKEVEVRPRVGGILLKKRFEEGAPIKAGQAMFLIDPVPFQNALESAKAQLAQQKARLEQTQREAQRLQGLLATQSISQREADNAASDYALARAGLAQMEANVREAELNLSYTTVTAPLSGIAGRFVFSEGALVSANTSLLTTISEISPIWVRFSLSDSELAQLGGRLSEKNVQKITLILPDGSEYQQPGKLNFAASQIDPSLGTQQLRATFDNANQQLLPGQFVRIRVTTGVQDGVFLVPQTAVLTGDKGKFVYVVEKSEGDKSIAGIRPIQVGSWQGTDWVVLSGLNAGDQVLVDNLIKIRPNAPIAPHPFGSAPALPDAK
ncbi:MAG: efflux RND transporter periplasmic adaptor subunit [Methylotenera sp.]|nr:efflux RND transporter periplasmic adaptor subunit [Methylotenera sp.]